MKISRNGITRIVVITKNYAIKFPRLNYGWKKFIEGMCCNMSESECWAATKSEHLCPVVYSWAGFFLVMKRVEILKENDEIPKVHLEGDGTDHKPDNYGWLDGKIVCVDYPYYRIKPYKR